MKEYFLNFKLELVICENKLLNLYKTFDRLTNEFKDSEYTNEKDINTFNISYEEVGYLLNTIYKSKIIYKLPQKSMDWIEIFESSYKDDPTLLENDNYLYNYLILKLRFIGFTDSFAKEYTLKFLNYRKENKETHSIFQLIDAIDSIFKLKEYFIVDNFYNYHDYELSFIKNIVSFRKDNPAISIKQLADSLIIHSRKTSVLASFNANKENLPYEKNKEYSLELLYQLTINYLIEYEVQEFLGKTILEFYVETYKLIFHSMRY